MTDTRLNIAFNVKLSYLYDFRYQLLQINMRYLPSKIIILDLFVCLFVYLGFMAY